MLFTQVARKLCEPNGEDGWDFTYICPRDLEVSILPLNEKFMIQTLSSAYRNDFIGDQNGEFWRENLMIYVNEWGTFIFLGDEFRKVRVLHLCEFQNGIHKLPRDLLRLDGLEPIMDNFCPRTSRRIKALADEDINFGILWRQKTVPWEHIIHCNFNAWYQERA